MCESLRHRHSNLQGPGWDSPGIMAPQWVFYNVAEQMWALSQQNEWSWHALFLVSYILWGERRQTSCSGWLVQPQINDAMRGNMSLTSVLISHLSLLFNVWWFLSFYCESTHLHVKLGPSPSMQVAPLKHRVTLEVAELQTSISSWHRLPV